MFGCTMNEREGGEIVRCLFFIKLNRAFHPHELSEEKRETGKIRIHHYVTTTKKEMIYFLKKRQLLDESQF